MRAGRGWRRRRRLKCSKKLWSLLKMEMKKKKKMKLGFDFEAFFQVGV